MLAVTLAQTLRPADGSFPTLTVVLSAVFFLASVYMCWRSFYRMRIDQPMLTKADMADAPRVEN
jgi:hypothetical protein